MNRSERIEMMRLSRATITQTHVAIREVRLQIEFSRRVVAEAVAMLSRLRGDRRRIDPSAES